MENGYFHYLKLINYNGENVDKKNRSRSSCKLINLAPINSKVSMKSSSMRILIPMKREIQEIMGQFIAAKLIIIKIIIIN